MTAEEIRKIELPLEGYKGTVSNELELNAKKVLVLREIAAQLAEANAISLKSGDAVHQVTESVRAVLSEYAREKHEKMERCHAADHKTSKGRSGWIKNDTGVWLCALCGQVSEPIPPEEVPPKQPPTALM